MKTYQQIQKRHQEEISQFPLFWAFNKEQFEEGKKKLGITENQDLLSFGAGGYLRKSDRELLQEMFKRQNHELREAMKDFNFCVGMFLYELGNHEYIITMDLHDTILACGLTPEEIDKSEYLSKALNKARDEYLKFQEYVRNEE